jgi:hypothetical protein
MTPEHKHPATSPRTGGEDGAEAVRSDSGDHDERRHEALRRFGYDPAVIYGLAIATDHSRGLTSPF